jgi:hypothetical protein
MVFFDDDAKHVDCTNSLSYKDIRVTAFQGVTHGETLDDLLATEAIAGVLEVVWKMGAPQREGSNGGIGGVKPVAGPGLCHKLRGRGIHHIHSKAGRRESPPFPCVETKRSNPGSQHDLAKDADLSW